MKTTKFLIGTLAVALITLIIISSCEQTEVLNDETVEFDVTEESIEIAEDEIFADAVFQDVINQSDLYEDDELLKSTECPTIARTLINDSTVQIIIDYSTEGCEQYIYNHRGVIIDTLVRKGRIITERYGYYPLPGSYKIVTPEDYSVNDVQIEGIYTIENMGFNTNSIMWFTVILEDGKITSADSLIMTREMNHERYWIAGHDTRMRADDEYLIWGTITGINPNGYAYTNTIIDSLHISLACRFILSGQVEIVVGDHDPIIIDYGDDDCDAHARIHANGNSKDIRQHFRMRQRAGRILYTGEANQDGNQLQEQDQEQNQNQIN